ncbi:MAG: hypothetical protein ABI963_07215, partial [Rhizomicrobium sp.]
LEKQQIPVFSMILSCAGAARKGLGKRPASQRVIPGSDIYQMVVIIGRHDGSRLSGKVAVA